MPAAPMTVADWIAIAAQIGVALGTGGLALFTWRLAQSTKRDVEAQWRPLLAPCEIVDTLRSIGGGTGLGTQVSYVETGAVALTTGGRLRFAVENIGKGPALKVLVWERGQDASGKDVLHPCPKPKGTVIAVGGTMNLAAYAAPDISAKVLVVDYADLAGVHYQLDVIYTKSEEGHWDEFLTTASGPHRQPIYAPDKRWFGKRRPPIG
jgi:hypothetical protein